MHTSLWQSKLCRVVPLLQRCQPSATEKSILRRKKLYFLTKKSIFWKFSHLNDRQPVAVGWHFKKSPDMAIWSYSPVGKFVSWILTPWFTNVDNNQVFKNKIPDKIPKAQLLLRRNGRERACTLYHHTASVAAACVQGYTYTHACDYKLYTQRCREAVAVYS